MFDYSKALKSFFVLTHEFERRPSVWRIFKTKKFVDLMEAFDTITKYDSFNYNDLL